MTAKNFWLRFNKYVVLFLLGGFLGWVIEILYRSVQAGKLVNPGFLSGPFLPIYGFGLILITLTDRWKFPWPWKIFIFSLLATALELFSGWFFDCFFHLRLWNYTAEWADFYGWICPRYYLYWVIIALLYCYFLSRPLGGFVKRFTRSRPKMIIAYIVLLLVIGDAGHSFHVADQIRSTFARYGYQLPVLADYKIFQFPSHSTKFFTGLWESIRGSSNFDLFDKIRQR